MKEAMQTNQGRNEARVGRDAGYYEELHDYTTIILEVGIDISSALTEYEM